MPRPRKVNVTPLIPSDEQSAPDEDVRMAPPDAAADESLEAEESPVSDESPAPEVPQPPIEEHVSTSSGGRVLYSYKRSAVPENWWFEGEFRFTADTDWSSVRDRVHQLLNMALAQSALGEMRPLSHNRERSEMVYTKLPPFDPRTSRVSIRIDIRSGS